MDFDGGRIQTHGLDADANDLLALQLLEDAIQHAALGPAVHAGVNGMPISEAFGQSAPLTTLLGDIEQGFRKLRVLKLTIAGRRGRLEAIRWYCASVISMHCRVSQNHDLVLTRPNQDVVYGGGFAALDKEPMVFQVPDFGKRYWVYPIYDNRTNEIGKIGQQYGTKPGFYMIVGPNWKGKIPAGITAIVRSSTDLAFPIPRIQMDDTAEDKKAIQAPLSKVMFYPLSQFDGKMKTTDWSKIPSVPVPAGPPNKWVNPETYFEQLSAVLKQVPALPGEQALYAQINAVFEAAAKDPAIKQALVESFASAQKELVDPLWQWRYNGIAAGNGWTTLKNGAEWGTDYYTRTSVAYTNIYVNVPPEAVYFYNDNDSSGAQMNGQNLYAVTFAKGQLPPVKGFWSLTLYNDRHLFNPNPLKRYSLGTKNKTLQYNPDGSLTLYAGATSPGKDKEANWLPAPNGTFSLYLRGYWADKAMLDGTWTPPTIEKVK